MESRCGGTRPDVVILFNDFGGNGAEIVLLGDAVARRVSALDGQSSRQQAQFFATLDGLGAAGGSELVEGAGTVGLDGIFGNEELRGDLAIAVAAGDKGEDFELACRDAEGLLASGIGREGLEGRGFCGDEHFLHHHRFADGFAAARDAEAEPNAEGREEDGNERAIELDGVLDNDEAVFGVLEGGDEETADETEDENVAPHDGVVKKYILACPRLRSRLKALPTDTP
jgi:hypothetical protein